MKPRVLLAAIFLAVLTAIPTMASAAFVHYFDCTECHRDGAAWNSVDGNGVCITCHDTTGSTYTFPRTRPDDGATSGVIPPGFATGDASNAFGNGNVPLAQDSHNWGASDRNPAAGASPASSAMYNTRRGASGGFVSCYKCHDPHSYYDADYATGQEKMLRTTAIGDGTSMNTEENIEAMCTECHLDWASVVGADRGFKSHPLTANDYDTVYGGGADVRFKTFAGSGDMALMSDGSIGCSTCHGLHKTDSGGANDGALLKTTGPSVDQSAVCTSCHVYMEHPGAETLGCMTCHSGHSYNDGTPNYFVLRSDVDTATFGPQTGLRYQDIRPIDGGATPIHELYAGPNGDDGYCTGCHGDITGSGPGEPSEIQPHSATDNCTQCHEHFDPANPTDPSFGGKGCTGCHGTPPNQNIAGGDPNSGYASDLGGSGHDYNSNNGPATYLLEANTPHETHAGTNPIAAVIACDICHNAHVTDFAAQHNNSVTGPTFQNVLEGAYAKDDITTGAGAMNPTYNGGTTNCDTVYCHSNGNAAGFVTTQETWNNGNGTISDCSSCHDDNTSNIGSGTKGNTAAHDVHVTRYDAVDVAGSSCNLCHADTTDGSTITNFGNHVDGTVQFATDSGFVIDTVSGYTLGGSAGGPASCAVYCHSDGDGGFSNPAWTDGSAAGACGACHSVNPLIIDTNQGGGAHFAHLSDPNGPAIATCNVCHEHAGEFTPNNGHIDGFKTVKTDACYTCHGRPGGGWTAAGTVDEAPVWIDPTTVRCDTCHSGTVANIGGAAPYVDETAYANGHGKTTSSLCTSCHEAATVNGHLGAPATYRLDAAIPAYVPTDDVAFCTDCHSAATNNHSTVDGSVCKTCHTQHGEANGFDAMIMSNVGGNAVTGFTAQGTRASYANASFTGICQTCHVDGVVNYFNRATNDQTHNAGQACSDCHTHDSTPKAFAGAGNACDACHGFPPATAAHGVHAPDSAALPTPVLIGIDRSSCDGCHTGAALYTYSPSDDQVAGGDRGNHNLSPANQVTVLTASVGYNQADGSCASACHLADNTRADWTVAGLACDSCHGNPPANGGFDGTAHVDHINAAGITCATCHGVDPVDTSHIIAKTGADEWTKITNMTDESIDAPPITEPSWNGTNNTCNTSVCHNPSPGAAYIADWDSSVSSCDLCHSSTDPATASHDEHMGAAAQFRITITCTDCHGDTTSGGTDMAHRSTTVELAGGITYTGDQNDLTPASWGTCSTTTCHNNGLGVAAVTPTWGTASADCTICHTEPPAGGSHPSHPASIASCTQCHDSVVPGTTAPTDHLDNNLDVYNAAQGDLGYPVTRALGAGSWTSCDTLTCHNDGQGTANGTTPPSIVTTPAWGDNAATCGQCHAASPTSAKHDEHLASYGATCGDCHAGVTDGSTLPTSNHLNTTIDVLASLNYTLGSTGMAPADGWGGCADPNTGCHSTPEERPWNDVAAGCNSCHGQSGGDGAPRIGTDMMSSLSLGQHATHVDANSYSCATCHTGGHFPALGGQDDTLQISFTGLGTGGGYNPPALWTTSPDKWLYTQASSTGTQDCSNLYCHSSGQADGGVGAPTYATPDWGNTASGACGSCHSDTDPATGSHTAHMNALPDNPTCNTCHSGNTHVDQNIDVPVGTYTSEGAPGNGYGSCSTATCHQDGTAPNNYVGTPVWGTVINNCNECHGEVPITGSHAVHVVTDSNDCSACHTGATRATSYELAAHRDDTVDVAIGGYTANKALGAAYETCMASCHDTGRNGNGLTQQWGTVMAACTECHELSPTTGSHTSHLADAAVNCGSCHDGAIQGSNGGVAHRDATIDTFLAIGYPQDKALGTAETTCGTASCHDTGRNSGLTDVWGTTLNNCSECHPTVPATFAHTTHLTTTITATIVCIDCHNDAVQGTTAPTGDHRDGNIDVYDTVAGDLGYPANKGLGTGTVTCGTSYCHGDNMPAGTTSGTTNAPNWNASSTGCVFCHDVTQAPVAIGAHDGKTWTDCITCHDNTNAAGNGFTDPTLHINGTLEGGGDTCTDCHNAADIDGALNGVHNSHVDMVTFLGTKTVSAGDYGTSGWWATTYTSGVASFGCGFCHPANEGTSHPVAGLNVDLDPGQAGAGGTIKTMYAAEDLTGINSRVSASCSTVYCHSDAAGTYQVTSATIGDWYAGTGQMSGDCNECHGNGPTTNAHNVHAVGIHMDDIYSGTNGTLTQGNSDPVDHGTATISTLSCQTCHNDTVTVSRNDESTACVTCHTGEGNRMVVATSSTVHIDGTKNVVFENATFRTKAQLRDDITGVVEVNTYWSRTSYKQAASVDTTNANLQGTATFSGGTCSTVACHNGFTATWTDSGVDCMYCHTDLPQ